MKHKVALFVGMANTNDYDTVTRKVNSWLEEYADEIEVVKIEHQQSINNNCSMYVSVMVHYLEK